MTLKRFKVGDPFKPSLNLLNGWTDAAQAEKRRKTGNRRPYDPSGPNPWKCWIRNDTGSSRSRFDVVALGNPLVLPVDPLDVEEFNTNPAYEGLTPQAITNGLSHVGSWALLLEPLDNPGDIGRAAIAGTWPCIVDLQHRRHGWCDVAHDSHTLTSNWYGCGQILWHEGMLTPDNWTPGLGEALVRISNFREEVLDAVVDNAYGINRNGSGTVRVKWNGEDTQTTLTAWYEHLTPAANIPHMTSVRIRYMRNGHKWNTVDHGCI